MRYDQARNQDRLDQGESTNFLRQLEDIDKRAFMRRFPTLIARQVIPTLKTSLHGLRSTPGVSIRRMVPRSSLRI